MLSLRSINTVTLWAMWKQTIPTTMQGFGDYCKNMVQDDGSNGNNIYLTLTDIRDDNQYKVAKLKDGRCWMIEDLKTAGITAHSTDTDMVAEDFYIPNTSSGFANVSSPSAYNHPTHGGFYSWLVATAGTGLSSANAGKNASGSICPKNWRLPTGGPNSEFYALDRAYGGNGQNGTDAGLNSRLKASPVPGFKLNGWYNQNQLYSENNEGVWFSSTIYNTNSAYYMYLGSSTAVQPLMVNDIYRGWQIRCISNN